MSDTFRQERLSDGDVIMCPCCRQAICTKCGALEAEAVRAVGCLRHNGRCEERLQERLTRHRMRYDHSGVAGFERPGTHGITVEAHLGALARIRELEALVAALRGEGGQA